MLYCTFELSFSRMPQNNDLASALLSNVGIRTFGRAPQFFSSFHVPFLRELVLISADRVRPLMVVLRYLGIRNLCHSVEKVKGVRPNSSCGWLEAIESCCVNSRYLNL